MRDTINVKRKRAYRSAESSEEAALLREATGTFVASLEAKVKPMGIKTVELATLLYDVVPAKTATEHVRDWGAYRPKTDAAGRFVAYRNGMSLDRLLRAIRGAVARYDWWDESVLAVLDRVKPVDRDAIRRFAAVCNEAALLAGGWTLSAEQMLAEIGNSVRLHPRFRPTKAPKYTVNSAGERVLAPTGDA